jgi:hypothetical protein
MTIYCHKSCFDGAVSAALSVWLLKATRGEALETIHPVDYSAKGNWTSHRLESNSCVVDFLYHPLASYWWDHHPTTFSSYEDRHHYSRRASNFVRFDPRAKSCASLISESFRAEQCELPPHLAESTLWANKLDSADYSSPEEAVLLDSAAQKISLSFYSDNSDSYHNILVNLMLRYDLNEVIENKEVRARITPALRAYPSRSQDRYVIKAQAKCNRAR